MCEVQNPNKSEKLFDQNGCQKVDAMEVSAFVRNRKITWGSSKQPPDQEICFSFLHYLWASSDRTLQILGYQERTNACRKGISQEPLDSSTVLETVDSR